MFWPILTVVALAALVVVHFRWRQKYFLALESSRQELRAVKEEHERSAALIHAQQSALFDSMIEGLLLLDQNGRIELANRTFAGLFGLNTNVKGKTVIEVLRQHEITKLIQRISAEKQVLDYELKLGGLDERWLQVNGAVMTAQNGERKGTLLVFHDLTRLKQLERTREEFVANVSHELRTPLSLIKGYVETLLDGAKDNAEVATKFLQTIHRNSERLQFLIEDLLTISELESGRLRMNLQTIQMRPLVDKVVEDFKTQAAGRHVTLTNELPNVSASGDADRLHQVFANLVGNAIKYGRSEGHIRVSARRSDGMIEVCVCDDGPGIPAEALDRVFERFYRVDKARSREQGGTGLGLSIVKHIVQGHGGKVWVESEPNQGAAFYFTVPAA